MTFPARVCCVLIGLLSVFLPLATPAFAQSTDSANQIITNSTNANVPQTVSTLSQGILWGMLSFASCAISGKDIASPTQKCLAYDSRTGKLGYVSSQDGGLLGLSTSAIAQLYSPPKFHVGTYIGYLRGSFSVIKPTFAAGPSGFDQLSPIMKLWIAFRNITYLLFVIVFVVIGFAIMLRAKIDPRTVMTIENQIPKIIIALVLVSFSYAIAGLVIDMMWLMTYVTINLFSSLDPALQPAQMTQNITQNPAMFIQQISTGGVLGILIQTSSSVYDILVPLVKQILDAPVIGGLLTFVGILPCFFQGVGNVLSNPVGTVAGGIGNAFGFLFGTVGNAINGTTGNVGTNPVDALGTCMQEGAVGLASGIAGVVAFLIFGFALLFALFRMWFTLLKSYSLFLIYAILGPFFIMLGILPGTKINVDNWIRHLLAYSMVFPFAIGTMLMGKVLSDVYTGTKIGYVPPLVGVTPGTISPIGPLIGFSIILLLPQALTMLQDSLSAPDIKYLPGIGQMLAGGTQAYSSLVSKPWQRYTRRADPLKGESEGGLRKFFMDSLGGLPRRLAGEEAPKK